MELILSTPQDLKHIVKVALAEFRAENEKQIVEPLENSDQLLTIDQAAEILNLTKPTIYTLVSRREIPVMKRSKRLYFSKNELIEYLKAGRKKTNAEIESEADQYLKRGRAKR